MQQSRPEGPLTLASEQAPRNDRKEFGECETEECIACYPNLDSLVCSPVHNRLGHIIASHKL